VDDCWGRCRSAVIAATTDRKVCTLSRSGLSSLNRYDAAAPRAFIRFAGLMSAVDLPPGIGLEGAAVAIFRSPRRARRIAYGSLLGTLLFGALTWWGVSRHPYDRHASSLVVIPVSLLAVSLIGVAVRRATVFIGRDGVRWGWRTLGFRQAAERVVEVRVYSDGATLRSKRGHWFLAARDWDRFDAMARALSGAGFPVQRYEGRAPWRQRSQSYGRALDGMLVLAAVVQAVLSTLPR
jgi:hypothetical protein